MGTEPLALSVPEAARELGCSERLLRTLVARREVPHARLGRRVVIPRDLLRAWLAERAAQNGEPPCRVTNGLAKAAPSSLQRGLADKEAVRNARELIPG